MDVLDLLFRRIVMAAKEAGALARPLDVAEVLDKLAPYRAARRDGLIDTNDDYLHAMMRLLSGERGFVFADETIQDDLAAELASPNPDLTVLRTYAQTKVRLATAEAERVLASGQQVDLRPPTPATPTPVISARPVRPSSAAPPPLTPTPAKAAPVVAPIVEAPSARTSIPGHGGCPYCNQPLPEGRPSKFCPSCGQNLLIRRCPGCSAEIESGWKFCVTCGRSAA